MASRTYEANDPYTVVLTGEAGERHSLIAVSET